MTPDTLQEKTRSLDDPSADRPERISVHRHHYEINVGDFAIVRWCSVCGMAEMLQKRMISDYFPVKWQRIDESYHV